MEYLWVLDKFDQFKHVAIGLLEIVIEILSI